MAYITVELLSDFAGKFAGKVTDIFAKKADIPKSLPADGGDADTVNGHSVSADVPEGAKFTDTTYSVMNGANASAAGKQGLVPAPSKGEADRFLRSDGTWAPIAMEATEEDIAHIIAGIFEEEGEA